MHITSILVDSAYMSSKQVSWSDLEGFCEVSDDVAQAFDADGQLETDLSELVLEMEFSSLTRIRSGVTPAESFSSSVSCW